MAYRFIPITSEPAAHARQASIQANDPSPEPVSYVDPSVETAYQYPGSGNPFTCVKRAHNYIINGPQAARLCRGSYSTAPVDCYSAAGADSLMPRSQLIALCQCATSLEPANCYSSLEQDTLLPPSEIVALCSPVMSGLVDRDCRPVYWSPE